jgi:hypothetical protein
MGKMWGLKGCCQEKKFQGQKNSGPDAAYIVLINKSNTMSLTLRTDFGCTEAIIDDDCGLKRFYEVADILTEEMDIKITEKQDDFETLSWHFLFKNLPLTLHYNIYTGISIFPQKFREAARRENDAVVEIAHFVENKLIIHSARKYLS